VNEAKYTDTLCDDGYECQDNVCVEIETGTGTIQQPVNYTLIITIAGAIAIAALIVIYIILKRKKKTAKSIEELKAKYRKRK
jgi:hypothetical protein